MRRSLAAAGLALASLVPLAGCGGSGFASIPDSGERYAGELEVDPRIRMRSIEFVPTRVRVAAGSTVTWVNEDEVAHTVVDGTELYNEFESPEVPPGGTYTRTFEKAGEIEYRCTIHASMDGALRIER